MAWVRRARGAETKVGRREDPRVRGNPKQENPKEGNPKVEQELDLFREDPQLSNVTELRNNLLPVIERIEKNPALRIMILKHGKPQAVLMSAQTYELVRKVMNQVAGQLQPASKEEAVKGAMARLRSERATKSSGDLWDTPASPSAEQMYAQMQSLMQTLQQFSSQLGTNSK